MLDELAQDERAAERELVSILGDRPDGSPVATTNGTGTAADGATEAPPTPTPSAPGHDVSIWLLGGFRLAVRDELVIGCGTDRSSPVLRFIAAYGPPGVHKELLAAQFWPDADAKTARRNLHQAIYNVRRLLTAHGAEDALAFTNDHYTLGDTPGLWRDVDELEHWVGQGRAALGAHDPATAVEAFRRADLAYGGEFLADHRYDEWALADRERYRALHREAAAALMTAGRAEGDHLSVLQAASRLLTLDPCDEDACRHLMYAHHALGQPHLATMAFHTLTDQLQRSYEIDPVPETVVLHTELSTEAGNL